jgi:hypothetical protein
MSWSRRRSSRTANQLRRHHGRLRRIVDLDDLPPDPPGTRPGDFRQGSRSGKEIGLVDRLITIVNGVDVEEPRCPASLPDRAPDGHLVADLPAASGRDVLPTSAPCRSASKTLSWSGGTLNSGYIDARLRIEGDDGELVALS